MCYWVSGLSVYCMPQSVLNAPLCVVTSNMGRTPRWAESFEQLLECMWNVWVSAFACMLPLHVSTVREVTGEVLSKISDLLWHQDNVHRDRNQEKTVSELPLFLQSFFKLYTWDQTPNHTNNTTYARASAGQHCQGWTKPGDQQQVVTQNISNKHSCSDTGQHEGFRGTGLTSQQTHFTPSPQRSTTPSPIWDNRDTLPGSSWSILALLWMQSSQQNDSTTDG